MRRMMREGIRAVARGEDPKGLEMSGHGPIPTYGNDTVLKVAYEGSEDGDRELVQETGLKLAEGFIDNPPSRVKGSR